MAEGTKIENIRNRDEVIRRVFESKYQSGAIEILFSMDDIRAAIAEVTKLIPSYRENNVADLRYQYASGRRPLPTVITVGLNTEGKQFIIPVEAKSSKDKLSKTQIAQMIDFASERYPKLLIRPVGVQEMPDGSLMLIEFTSASHPDDIKVKEMRRYRLVSMEMVKAARS